MSILEQMYRIIDDIEGGYYHPDMKSKLRNGERMLDSGETMFGLDRKNGAPRVTTDTADGVEFWKIIDKYYGNHHGDTAYYGDKANGKKSDIPASVGEELKRLACRIQLYSFNDYSKYLSNAAKKIINKNPKLYLQFLYATWNGSGHFQDFAKAVNKAVASGNTNPDALYEIVQKARRAKGGLFAEGADKLDIIVKGIKNNSMWWVIGLTVAVIAIFAFSNSKTKTE